MTADKLAKIYVKIRDKRRDLEKQAAELKSSKTSLLPNCLRYAKSRAHKLYVPNLVRCPAGQLRTTGLATGVPSTTSSKNTTPLL